MAKVDIKDWQAKHGTAMAAITAVEAALQDIPSSVMGPRKPDVFARNQAALHATISGEIETFKVSLLDDYKREGEDTCTVAVRVLSRHCPGANPGLARGVPDPEAPGQGRAVAVGLSS